MGGRLIRLGRSEAEAQEKDAFYLRAVLCSPSGKDLQTAVDWKMSQVSIFIVLLRPLTILVSPEVLKVIISYSFQGASISFMFPHRTLIPPCAFLLL